jgi:Na+/H+-dicarboxylate symporter
MAANPVKQQYLISAAVGAAFVANYLDLPSVYLAADVLSQIFIKILRLLSMPLVFFSLCSSIVAVEKGMKRWARHVMTYTALTTFLAALSAWVLLLLLNPNYGAELPVDVKTESLVWQERFLGLIPDNVLAPFHEHSVFGVLFLAVFAAMAARKLGPDQRQLIITGFETLFRLTLIMAKMVVGFLPLLVFCLLLVFLKEAHRVSESVSLLWYVLTILSANAFQALVVLPILLILKGIQPLALAKNMWPAILLAFFSKSSAVALPKALECAVDNAKMDEKVARFSLPLCITINMNACAAFILVTFLFVSGMHGVHYSLPMQFFWVLAASMAAVGNAAVPMGCYFLASSLLAANHIPLVLMGVILPVYALIDMFESAINVWSDAVVTAIVDKNNR